MMILIAVSGENYTLLNDVIKRVKYEIQYRQELCSYAGVPRPLIAMLNMKSLGTLIKRNRVIKGNLLLY